MPFFLVVPPTEMLTDNAENSARMRALSEEFRTAAVKELTQQPALPLKSVPGGGYPGTRYFPWDKDFHAILRTVFVFPPGKNQTKEMLRTQMLVRQRDCLSLGSNWTPGTAPTTWKVPEEFANAGGTPLQKILARSFRQLSSVGIDAKFVGPSASRNSFLFSLFLTEELANRGIPVLADTGRHWCVAPLPPESSPQPVPTKQTETKQIMNSVDSSRTPPAEAEVTYPARAHRTVRAQFVEESMGKSAPSSVTFVTGHLKISSTPLKGHQQTVAQFLKPVAYSPKAFCGELVNVLSGALHEMSEDTMRVTARKGRWITLDRGRAYGLSIGMHIVCASAAKAHVIHFEPLDKEWDAAVAMIRQENRENPVKPGDTCTFDSTLYPVGAP